MVLTEVTPIIFVGSVQWIQWLPEINQFGEIVRRFKHRSLSQSRFQFARKSTVADVISEQYCIFEEEKSIKMKIKNLSTGERNNLRNLKP